MPDTFGSIGKLHPTTLVVIFDLTIVVVIALEFSLTKVRKWASKNNYDGLYKVLVKELLQLGIISFILFLLESGGYTAEHENDLEAFDFTHIVVLFIAFAFIIQACFLVQVKIICILN